MGRCRSRLVIPKFLANQHMGTCFIVMLMLGFFLLWMMVVLSIHVTHKSWDVCCAIVLWWMVMFTIWHMGKVWRGLWTTTKTNCGTNFLKKHVSKLIKYIKWGLLVQRTKAASLIIENEQKRKTIPPSQITKFFGCQRPYNKSNLI
jgi:hypothetical protein